MKNFNCQLNIKPLDVSEFMFQNLVSITLHGMLRNKGVKEGALKATGVTPLEVNFKGVYHKCKQR